MSNRFLIPPLLSCGPAEQMMDLRLLRILAHRFVQQFHQSVHLALLDERLQLLDKSGGKHRTFALYRAPRRSRGEQRPPWRSVISNLNVNSRNGTEAVPYVSWRKACGRKWSRSLATSETWLSSLAARSPARPCTCAPSTAASN